MIVTNARIFRLKPEVSALEEIREASSPKEIADEVGWTWCYYDPPKALFLQNIDTIEAHKQRESRLMQRYALVERHINNFSSRPNWIAVVNVKSLSIAANAIFQHFLSLPTVSVAELLEKHGDEAL